MTIRRLTPASTTPAACTAPRNCSKKRTRISPAKSTTTSPKASSSALLGTSTRPFTKWTSASASSPLAASTSFSSTGTVGVGRHGVLFVRLLSLPRGHTCSSYFVRNLPNSEAGARVSRVAARSGSCCFRTTRRAAHWPRSRRRKRHLPEVRIRIDKLEPNEQLPIAFAPHMRHPRLGRPAGVFVHHHERLPGHHCLIHDQQGSLLIHGARHRSHAELFALFILPMHNYRQRQGNAQSASPLAVAKIQYAHEDLTPSVLWSARDRVAGSLSNRTMSCPSHSRSLAYGCVCGSQSRLRKLSGQ